MGWAALSTSFSPTSVEVNTMNTISFDPKEPLTQPQLTTLKIESDLPATKIDLKVVVYWSNNRLVEANFESLDDNWGYVLNNKRVVEMSNRHLISEDGHPDFKGKEGNSISVEDVINANPILKNAVLAGYFPDGNLELRIWVRPWMAGNWTEPGISPAIFTIKIRNAGAINLLTPGVAVGQNPPQISERPISFQWNAVSTGFNNSKLVIKEFPANNPPNLNSVVNTGSIFYQNDNVESGFADFLAFNPGNYYAWQVSTDLFSEFNPINHYKNPSTPTSLASNWFVFRFVNEAQNNSQNAADMQAQLNMLNNLTLRNLISQGYNPVGTVIYEGRTYTGQDALDLLSGLVGKELQVQLKD
jgi:hypothetical protein